MISTKTRPLNLNDLADAHRMSDAQRSSLATPVIESLRTISAPTGRDEAGIAHRGRSVFEPYLVGHTTRELAAAYVELRGRGCQLGVIDEIEVASAVVTGESK